MVQSQRAYSESLNSSLPFRHVRPNRNNPRNATQYRPIAPPPPPLAAPKHGLHLFCTRCIEKIWLGDTAFRLFLSIGWLIGLAGIMCTEQKSPIPIIFLIYLFAQMFGLLALISKIKRLFIPYFLVLVLMTLLISTGLVHFTLREFSTSYVFISRNFDLIKQLDKLNTDEFNKWVLLTISVLFLFFNMLCIFAVGIACRRMDEYEQITIQRRREQMARHAMIYNRLISISHGQSDDIVIANVDSPPRYTSLSKVGGLESPPPNYSEWKRNQKKTVSFSISNSEGSSTEKKPKLIE